MVVHCCSAIYFYLFPLSLLFTGTFFTFSFLFFFFFFFPSHSFYWASLVKKDPLPTILSKWWLSAPSFWCKKYITKWLTLSSHSPDEKKELLIEVHLLCTVKTKNSVNYYILINGVQQCSHFNQWVLKFQLSWNEMKHILKYSIIECYSIFYKLFLSQLQRAEFL